MCPTVTLFLSKPSESCLMWMRGRRGRRRWSCRCPRLRRRKPSTSRAPPSWSRLETWCTGYLPPTFWWLPGTKCTFTASLRCNINWIRFLLSAYWNEKLKKKKKDLMLKVIFLWTSGLFQGLFKNLAIPLLTLLIDSILTRSTLGSHWLCFDS